MTHICTTQRQYASFPIHELILHCTNLQVTKIVVLAEGWTLECPQQGHFSDVPHDNSFFCYIETAVSHGIINGYGDGTFLPSNPAFRGQISKIVYLAITQP